MQFQGRSLRLFFILVALCFTAAGQKTQTVNLRPRIVAPAPGVPVVNVSVDRRRVPLGTQVTFSVTPAAIVTNPKYQVTLYFGDRDQQVLRTSVIGHFYPAAGTYTYSIVVKPSHEPLDPTVDDPPRVSLVVSPSSVEERHQVKFSALLSRNSPNLQYRFDYGDGTPSGWQSSAQAAHAYENAGRYFPFVDISDGKRQLGGSQKQSVTVTKPGSLTVYLTANPRSARLRQRVTFNARVSRFNSNTKYWFDFGDGSQPFGWQASPQTTYTYSQPGSYPAYVQVAQLIGGASLTATSNPVSVNVQRPTPTPSPRPSPQPSPRPTPNASPTPSPTPDASPAPTANTSPTPFGGTSPTPDGSPSPGPTTSPNPSDSPIGGNTTPSPTADPSASNSGLKGPAGLFGGANDWWKYSLILALILFLVYQATALLFAAQPVFTPFSDAGVAGIADAKGALPIDFQMVLNPNVTAGDYQVKTDAPSLITNPGGFGDRELLEI
jgi:hypothetical protein